MRTVREISHLRELLDGAEAPGGIGMIATMGNLHAGHLELAAASLARCDLTVATVFVNPLQFGANEDLDSYPRTLADDQARLERTGVDVLFAPDESELFPEGRDRQTTVSVPGLSDVLCGASRPGHFDGVTTIVLKLLNIVKPQTAFFGRKDYQQLTVIEAMVRQLNVDVEIVGVETVRADDGLALSSRNAYLDDGERAIAPELYATLRGIATALREGNRDLGRLEDDARQHLDGLGFQSDYIAIRDAQNLATASRETRQLIILGAAQLGSARLIDNVGVDLR